MSVCMHACWRHAPAGLYWNEATCLDMQCCSELLSQKMIHGMLRMHPMGPAADASSTYGSHWKKCANLHDNLNLVMSPGAVQAAQRTRRGSRWSCGWRMWRAARRAACCARPSWA